MLAARIPAERDDVRVLEQEQRVRNGARLARSNLLPLQAQALGVEDHPELFNVAKHERSLQLSAVSPQQDSTQLLAEN